MSEEITILDILEDIRAADEILQKFERKYRIHSEVFYNIYSQGLLDDGEHLEDFAEWSGFYKLRLRREAMFREAQPRPGPEHQLHGAELALSDRGNRARAALNALE